MSFIIDEEKLGDVIKPGMDMFLKEKIRALVKAQAEPIIQKAADDLYAQLKGVLEGYYDNYHGRPSFVLKLEFNNK